MNNENNSSYKIIVSDSTGEYEEKKSRFIGYLHFADSEEAATSFINSIKKKHYDARHNCSAMIIGDSKEVVRSSDDGEPSGTAGKPMLEVLSSSGLTNVVAVVTRYFGGTLLGTGGLVRAYQAAVKEALANADIRTISLCRDIAITVSYSDSGSVEYYLTNASINIMSTDYLTDVTFNIRVLLSDASRISSEINNLSKGKAQINTIQEGYLPL